MRSQLDCLKGLTITKIVEIHDYVQLHFGDGVGVSIYNEIEVRPSSATIPQFVGKTITLTVEKAAAIEFVFRDRSRINVDMHRRAYRGAEALELNRRGHPPVIWN